MKTCFNIEKVAEVVASVRSIRRAARVAKIILLPGLTNRWQSMTISYLLSIAIDQWPIDNHKLAFSNCYRLPPITIDCNRVRCSFGQPRYVPYNFNNCYVISSHCISSVKPVFLTSQKIWKSMIVANRWQSMTFDNNRWQSMAIKQQFFWPSIGHRFLISID